MVSGAPETAPIAQGSPTSRGWLPYNIIITICENRLYSTSLPQSNTQLAQVLFLFLILLQCPSNKWSTTPTIKTFAPRKLSTRRPFKCFEKNGNDYLLAICLVKPIQPNLPIISFTRCSNLSSVAYCPGEAPYVVDDWESPLRSYIYICVCECVCIRSLVEVSTCQLGVRPLRFHHPLN